MQEEVLRAGVATTGDEQADCQLGVANAPSVMLAKLSRVLASEMKWSPLLLIGRLSQVGLNLLLEASQVDVEVHVSGGTLLLLQSLDGSAGVGDIALPVGDSQLKGEVCGWVEVEAQAHTCQPRPSSLLLGVHVVVLSLALV